MVRSLYVAIYDSLAFYPSFQIEYTAPSFEHNLEVATVALPLAFDCN